MKIRDMYGRRLPSLADMWGTCSGHLCLWPVGCCISPCSCYAHTERISQMYTRRLQGHQIPRDAHGVGPTFVPRAASKRCGWNLSIGKPRSQEELNCGQLDVRKILPEFEIFSMACGPSVGDSALGIFAIWIACDLTDSCSTIRP